MPKSVDYKNPIKMEIPEDKEVAIHRLEVILPRGMSNKEKRIRSIFYVLLDNLSMAVATDRYIEGTEDARPSPWYVEYLTLATQIRHLRNAVLEANGFDPKGNPQN